DEDQATPGLDRQVVNVEIAGGIAAARHVEAVAALVQLPRPEDVLETPQLVERTEPQGLTVAPQPHAAVEGAFEHGQPAIGMPAQEEQFAGLVGGEGQADPL